MGLGIYVVTSVINSTPASSGAGSLPGEGQHPTSGRTLSLDRLSELEVETRGSSQNRRPTSLLGSVNLKPELQETLT